MDGNRPCSFGGTMGQVLRDANSLGTVVTGVVLGLSIIVSACTLSLLQVNALTTLVGQAIIAVALARFALNGLVGESRGTVFSTAGGSWPEVVVVACRYLALNIWAAPLVAIAWWILAAAANTPVGLGGAPDPAQAMPGRMPFMPPILLAMMSKGFLLTMSLLLCGMVLLPPVLLIVAVRAERFADVVSPDLWRACFKGRLGDLYLIYVVHGGGLGTLLIVAIPALVLGFAAAPAIGWLFLAVGLTFGGGLAVTLLGRLCGFYAFGEEHESAPVGRRPMPELHVVAPRVPAEKATEAAGSVAPPSGKPPLLDPAGRVAAARRRFEQDRDGALQELRELELQHAPSPHVRHALTLCLIQAGRIVEALAAARSALPLCIERGNLPQATEIFGLLWRQAKDLGLNREQVDVVGTALAKSGDVVHAITAFGLALSMDPGDRRAIKGLLQMAEHRMQRDGRPKDAARIYTFLLQYAADTPFVDDMRRGLAEAETRLRRAG